MVGLAELSDCRMFLNKGRRKKMCVCVHVFLPTDPDYPSSLFSVTDGANNVISPLVPPDASASTHMTQSYKS